jgi:hypothetical protein
VHDVANTTTNPSTPETTSRARSDPAHTAM